MALPKRLALTGVEKRYGSVQALADVSFDLKAGEILALLGENGAGKSTVVKIIGGLVNPDGGTIEIDGVGQEFSSSSDAQSAGIAVVTQEFSLVPSMSIAENLALGQIGTGSIWTPRSLASRAKASLLAVGLEDIDPNTAVERLTVAERQLLEIARVVQRDAKVVIFDEPTAALSDHEIERVHTIVRKLAADGRGVIYVTHRLTEVFALSTRVQIFRNGRSLPSQLTTDLDETRLVEAMLGREIGQMYPDRAETDHRRESAITLLSTHFSGMREPVDLVVKKGEILGLTGQIGSGAAQVLAGLAGVNQIRSGEIRLADGTRLDVRGRARGIKQGIAYCSPDRKADGIFPGMSIIENLASPWISRVSTRGWLSVRKRDALAAEVASDFAIDARRLTSAVGELSGGNQQKVALGKWLGIDPLVLLADEPTRGVDVGARAEIYLRLRQLADSGVAIVIASTDSSEVLGLSDVVATFYRGTLTRVDRATNWTEPELVSEVMGQAHMSGSTERQAPIS